MTRPLSASDFQQLSPLALKYSADWFLAVQEGRWAALVHAALPPECLRWTTLLPCILTVFHQMLTKA